MMTKNAELHPFLFFTLQLQVLSSVTGSSSEPTYDFRVAIQEVDTIVPEAVKILNSTNIVDVYTKLSNGGWNDELISIDDFQLSCNVSDICPTEDNDGSHKMGNTDGIISFTAHPNHSSNPYLCRCDLPDCMEFGDCCFNVTVGQKFTERSNYWRCIAIVERVCITILLQLLSY